MRRSSDVSLYLEAGVFGRPEAKLLICEKLMAKKVFHVTDSARVPFGILLDIMCDDGESNFEKFALFYFGDGEKHLKRKLVPLGLLRRYLRDLGPSGLPWPTANCSNLEYFAYMLRWKIEEHFGGVVDTLSLARFCRIPDESLCASPYVDCVNGTMLLKDGYSYLIQHYSWHAKSGRTLSEKEFDAEITADNENEYILAKHVVTESTQWDVYGLQRRCNEAGWDYDCSDLATFNYATRRFKNIFQWEIRNGFDRTAVGDWDHMIQNRRFMFAFGSGSNIQVHTPITTPAAPVAS